MLFFSPCKIHHRSAQIFQSLRLPERISRINFTENLDGLLAQFLDPDEVLLVEGGEASLGVETDDVPDSTNHPSVQLKH